MKWRFFVSACLVIGLALFKAGAPPLAIISGIGFATLINLMRRRKESLAPKQRSVRTANS